MRQLGKNFDALGAGGMRHRVSSLSATALASVLLSVMVIGVDRLDPGNTSWLWGDLAQVYTAWSQYLADPGSGALRFTWLSHPLDISVALFDPMPIWLLLVQPFDYLLNLDGQFIGLYFAVCVFLQGLFGYLIVALLVNDPRLSSPQVECVRFLGAVLFITVPYTFYRFQGHTALSSQWVLLLGIWVSLRVRQVVGLRWIFANASVLLLATGLNPYLALMVGLNSAALAGESLWSRHWLRWLGRIVVLAAIGVIGLWLFGFMDVAGARGGGYGTYSMNVLGPFDSNGDAIIGALDVPDPTGGQTFEGFCYLGIGALFIGAYGIWSAAKREQANSELPTCCIAIVVLVSFLLSLSTTVSIWSVKFDVVNLGVVEDLLSRFRASGRLFWIGGFWLIIYGIHMIFLKHPGKRGILVLFLLVVLQVIDISGLAIKTSEALATNRRLAIADVDKVRGIGKYDAIIVVPPWQCGHETTPGGVRNYEIFGFYAIENSLPTNNFYAARVPERQRKYHCNQDSVEPRLNRRYVYYISSEKFEKGEYEIGPNWRCVSTTEMEDVVRCAHQRAEAIDG